MKRVFFDNAATTPIDPLVVEAMHEVMVYNYGNPSSIHKEGREARTVIEKARKTVASLLGVSPGEIFFTSGGTEADNMAIKCLVQQKKIDTIISSKIEHHAVTHTVEECQELFGANIHWVNLLEDGHIDLNNLEELLQKSSQGRTLVSLMHANNEIGNILDINKVGELCSTYNAYFHTDTVQTIGHIPIDIKASKIDFLAASAHKFNGPKGVGFIYINNAKVKIKPFMSGGAQERNMRGGTENIYSIIGLAKALEISYSEMDAQHNKILELKKYMSSKLLETIPNITFNGGCMGDKSSFTVLNVSFPPFEGADMLLFNLDINGIAVSGGSACSSGSDVGSHVLSALKTSPDRASVRFSFGKYNTKEEVDFVIEKIKELVLNN
jgi:cysteine desulfurase